LKLQYHIEPHKTSHRTARICFSAPSNTSGPGICSKTLDAVDIANFNQRQIMAPNNLPNLHRFTEFINSGDISIGQEVISESAVFHVPFGESLKGLDGYLQILGMMCGAFPDINSEE
jgi:hypothetical protein